MRIHSVQTLFSLRLHPSFATNDSCTSAVCFSGKDECNRLARSSRMQQITLTWVTITVRGLAICSGSWIVLSEIERGMCDARQVYRSKRWDGLVIVANWGHGRDCACAFFSGIGSDSCWFYLIFNVFLIDWNLNYHINALIQAFRICGAS